MANYNLIHGYDYTHDYNHTHGYNNTHDYNSVLMENTWTRIGCLSFCTVAIFVQPILFYSLVWYDKYSSDDKRTFLNMLSTSLAWLMIEYTLLVQTTEVFRFIIGPLPNWFCFFKSVIRTNYVSQVFVYFDCISVIKYLFIFHLKNPAAFQDGFWIIFLNIWIKGFCLLFNLAWFITVDHQIISFYICSGQDPTEDMKKPLKIYHVLEITSLLVQLVICIRIKYYKFQMKHKVQNEDLKHIFVAQMSKDSLVNLTTSLINILAIVALRYCTSKLDSMNYAQIIENRDLILFTYLIFPPLFAYVVIVMLYARHSKLRKSVWNELKESFINR